MPKRVKCECCGKPTTQWNQLCAACNRRALNDCGCHDSKEPAPDGTRLLRDLKAAIDKEKRHER